MENVDHIATELLAVVSQIMLVADQSPSNLAVVTNIIKQISNLSSQNEEVVTLCTNCAILEKFLPTGCHQCCWHTQQYSTMASKCAGRKWFQGNDALLVRSSYHK